MLKEFIQETAEAFAELRYRPEDGTADISGLFDAAMDTLLHTRDLLDAKKVLGYLNFCLGSQDDVLDTYNSYTDEVEALMAGHERHIRLVPGSMTHEVCYVTNAVADEEGSMYYVRHDDDADEDEEPMDEADPFEDFGAQKSSASLSVDDAAPEAGITSVWNTFISNGDSIYTAEDDTVCIVPGNPACDRIKLYEGTKKHMLGYDYDSCGIYSVDDKFCYLLQTDDDTLEVYDRKYISRSGPYGQPDKSMMLARIRFYITDWQDMTGVARIEYRYNVGIVDINTLLLLAASALIMHKQIHSM